MHTFASTGWLAGFYGISTLVGYLRPHCVYIYGLHLCKTICAHNKFIMKKYTKCIHRYTSNTILVYFNFGTINHL